MPLSGYCHKAISTNEKKKQQRREGQGERKERNTRKDYIFTGENTYPSNKIISMINSSTVPYLANGKPKILVIKEGYFLLNTYYLLATESDNPASHLQGY